MDALKALLKDALKIIADGIKAVVAKLVGLVKR